MVNSDRPAIETLESWLENLAISLARNENDAKDIYIDNVAATLEAHRASNRAPVIRYVSKRAPVIRYVRKPVIFTRALRKQALFLEQSNDGDGGAEKTHTKIHEEKEGKLIPMWPLDSVQAKAKYGEQVCGTYRKKRDALEYTGAITYPQGSWEKKGSFKDTQDTQMRRPWLAYMRTTGEDNRERFVVKSRQGWL